jgi:hypothetical protein
MRPKPIAIPSTGERTSGTRTLPTIPSTFRASVPDAAMTAPIRPPMSAWLDDEGMPTRHVMRFHVIAPMSAAATMIWPSSPDGVVAMPAAIVFATAVPVRAPRKFAVADIRMAW